ncbi:hypothetical protein F4780DRAFT_521165 [Xylariomycetidae sp. FL0641]|nr:hypothetical protein F4780DRAFT_521165 [Xylariomycetidae sp. FL0641]
MDLIENGGNAPGSVVDGTKRSQQPKKRAMTDARRESNRTAQRAWRKRQKEQKEAFRNKPARIGPRRLEPRPLPENGRGIEAPPRGTGETERKQDLINAEPISGPRSTLSEPLHPGGELDLFDYEISVDSEPISSPSRGQPVLFLPSETMLPPLASCLLDAQTTVRTACLHNALCLGIDILQLFNCSCLTMSPFFRPTPTMPSSSASRSLIDSSCAPQIPLHLRPTPAQVLVPHHASIDLIPLPALRERAILLAAALPHLFDPWELKLDIYVRGALVCWQARRGATCLPWDASSWEAMPWFLAKWQVVVDGGAGMPQVEPDACL